MLALHTASPRLNDSYAPIAALTTPITRSYVSGYQGYRTLEEVDVDVDQYKKAVGFNPMMKPPPNVKRSLGRGAQWKDEFKRASSNGTLNREVFERMLETKDPTFQTDHTNTIYKAVTKDNVGGEVSYEKWAKYLDQYKREEHSIEKPHDPRATVVRRPTEWDPPDTERKGDMGFARTQQVAAQKKKAKRNVKRIGYMPQRHYGKNYAEAALMFKGKQAYTPTMKNGWMTTKESFNARVYDGMANRASREPDWFTTTQSGWTSQSGWAQRVDCNASRPLSASFQERSRSGAARPVSASRFTTTNQAFNESIYGRAGF